MNNSTPSIQTIITKVKMIACKMKNYVFSYIRRFLRGQYYVVMFLQCISSSLRRYRRRLRTLISGRMIHDSIFKCVKLQRKK